MLGVSTSVLGAKSDLDALLAYEPDLVEFYNYPAAAVPDIARFCRTHGLRPALHTPVPYDEPEPLTTFAPTGPDPEAARRAFRLAAGTVSCAAQLGAEHVVVHFPSPYPPYPQDGFDAACERFLGPLGELAAGLGVRVLIENLSPNPLLRTPERYAELLRRYPQLGLCLDVGHAHLAPEPDGPDRFISLLGKAVRSVHLYNTAPQRRRRYGHEPISPAQTAADGHLDVAPLVRRVLNSCAPSAIVLEHGPVSSGSGIDAARWLRSLLPASGSHPDCRPADSSETTHDGQVSAVGLPATTPDGPAWRGPRGRPNSAGRLG